MMKLNSVLRDVFPETFEYFEKKFFTDILISERARVSILIFIFSAFGITTLIFANIFKEEYIRVAGTFTIVYEITLSFLAIVLYQLFVRFEIQRIINSGKTFPDYLRFINTFVETSFPTVIIIIVSQTVHPILVMIGPASFAYFPFIVLSALRLDFRISVFTGAVAALQYLLLAIYYINNSFIPDDLSRFASVILYSSKAGFYLISGVAAGFVTIQLRKRILSSIKSVEEKNRIINLFGQQVSPQVVDELLQLKEEFTGELREVTVMFLDIRNFTAMVENKSPQEIVAYQNKIFGLTVEVVGRYGGVVNQFLGDGFMATFGAPIKKDNHCSNAVSASLEIIAKLNNDVAHNNLTPTKVGIGIHTGEAVTGNIGSDSRKQYSVTGNVVIIASRIEQLNKKFGSQVLVSEEVILKADIKDLSAHPLGPVELKGREKPVQIFRLV